MAQTVESRPWARPNWAGPTIWAIAPKAAAKLINAYGNGGVNPDLIKFALKVIGPKRTLVLVTAYDADVLVATAYITITMKSTPTTSSPFCRCSRAPTPV